MLLLTDRPAEGQRLQRIASAIEPCTLVTLDHPSTAVAGHAAIVCDVALGHPAALAVVQAVLAQHRVPPSMPLLLLDRGGAAPQAQAIGADVVLPRAASDAQILFTIRRLVEACGAPAGRAGRTADPAVQGGVRDAEAAFADIFLAAQRGRSVALDSLDRGGEAVVATVGGERIGAWLDVVRAFDDVTYQHCLLVAGLAASFSARLGVTSKGQRLIVQAALVHDIGKARIPVDILNKPGPLSPDEMHVMRTHPRVGHELLSRQGGFDPQLLDIVRHHHEYVDGTGYPDGLSGERVSPVVRLVTICDIYSALVERRSYKAPTSPREALGVLDGMGGKLDRGLLRSFAGLITAA